MSLIKEKCYTLKIERIMLDMNMILSQQLARMQLINIENETLQKLRKRVAEVNSKLELIELEAEKGKLSESDLSIQSELLLDQAQLMQNFQIVYTADPECQFLQMKMEELLLNEEFHKPLFDEVYSEWKADNPNELYKLYSTFKNEYDLQKKK